MNENVPIREIPHSDWFRAVREGDIRNLPLLFSGLMREINNDVQDAKTEQVIIAQIINNLRELLESVKKDSKELNLLPDITTIEELKKVFVEKMTARLDESGTIWPYNDASFRDGFINEQWEIIFNIYKTQLGRISISPNVVKGEVIQPEEE